jgi:hypothetical protein
VCGVNYVFGTIIKNGNEADVNNGIADAKSEAIREACGDAACG